MYVVQMMEEQQATGQWKYEGDDNRILLMAHMILSELDTSGVLLWWNSLDVVCEACWTL